MKQKLFEWDLRLCILIHIYIFSCAGAWLEGGEVWLPQAAEPKWWQN